jgi:hypothetical protein
LCSTYFVEERYDDANRTNGAFGIKPKWREWFDNGWFEIIENQTKMNPEELTYEDSDAYIGNAHERGSQKCV